MIPTSSIVHRLRVHTPDGESTAVRLAVAQQIESLELQPRGMAPSSILLLRSLKQAIPSSRDPPHRSGAAHWQRQLQEKLEAAARHAVRPRNGRIQANASAVLFIDEAELLAFLALELCSHSSDAAWLRQALARYMNDSLQLLLQRNARLMPAILATFQQWEVLEAVIGSMSAHEARDCAEELADEYALHHVTRILREPVEKTDPAGTAEPNTRSSRAPPGAMVQAQKAAGAMAKARDGSAATGGLMARSPFGKWFTARDSRLGGNHQQLIGLALGVKHAPVELALPQFAERIADWLAQPVDSTGRTVSSMQGIDATDARLEDAHRQFDGATENSKTPRRPASSASPEQRSDDAAASQPMESLEVTTPPNDTHIDAAPNPERVWASEGVVTQLGGLFYLVNAMEHLGLPDCFEESWHLASSVGAAGTLEAIGRVLAGACGDELRHDPIWAVLARVDGRAANTPPRAQGLAPRLQGLPAAWREMLPDDTPLQLSDADTAAMEALRRAAWPPALLDWLALAMPFIEWRIAHACSLAGFDDVAGLLLEFPARVYVTEAHIDVVASVESIRVPLRLAGLDRSPGWVRSLQRIVLIHFE